MLFKGWRNDLLSRRVSYTIRKPEFRFYFPHENMNISDLYQ